MCFFLFCKEMYKAFLYFSYFKIFVYQSLFSSGYPTPHMHHSLPSAYPGTLPDVYLIAKTFVLYTSFAYFLAPIFLEGVIGNWGLFGENVGSQGFPTQVFDVCFCSDQSKDGRLCRRIQTESNSASRLLSFPQRFKILTAKDKAQILRDGFFYETQAIQPKKNGSAVFLSASNDKFIYL